MTKGDIVLVQFPYSDFSGQKLRPVVVLYNDNKDIISCFITSQTKLFSENDITIFPNEFNGLKHSSVIKVSKIGTIDKLLVAGLLGKLSEIEINKLNSKLISLFKL